MPADNGRNEIVCRLLGLPPDTLHPAPEQLLGLARPGAGAKEIDQALALRLRQLRSSVPPQFRPILFYIERQLQEAAAALKGRISPVSAPPTNRAKSQAPRPPTAKLATGISHHVGPSPAALPIKPPSQPARPKPGIPAVPPAYAPAHPAPAMAKPDSPRTKPLLRIPATGRPAVPPQPQPHPKHGLTMDPDAVQYRRESQEDEPFVKLHYELWEQLDRWLRRKANQ